MDAQRRTPRGSASPYSAASRASSGARSSRAEGGVEVDGEEGGSQWAEVVAAASKYRDAPPRVTPRTPLSPRWTSKVSPAPEMEPLATEETLCVDRSTEEPAQHLPAAQAVPEHASAAPEPSSDAAGASVATHALSRLPITWEGALSRGLAALAAAVPTPRSARRSEAGAGKQSGAMVAAPAVSSIPRRPGVSLADNAADAALHRARDQMLSRQLGGGTKPEGDHRHHAWAAFLKPAALSSSARRIMRNVALDVARACLVALWALTGVAIVAAAIWHGGENDTRIQE